MPSFHAEPFAPRPASFRGVLEHADWRIKRYDISHPDVALNEISYAAGLVEILARLPEPATTLSRPGVGFVICHEGLEVAYIVLCWWDNENELIIRLIVRDRGAASPWRDAEGKYSFCVWDLDPIWHERNAYIRHMMQGQPSAEAYLADALEPQERC